MADESRVVEWNGVQIKAHAIAGGRMSVHWMSDWTQVDGAIKAGVIIEKYLGLGCHASDLYLGQGR